MKPTNTTPEINVSSVPTDFTPTQEQIDTLARRLMPEIKKFFADEQVQKDFAEWKAATDRQSQQNAA